MLGETKLMLTLSLPVIFWSTMAVQLIGLAAIAALRLFPNGRLHAVSQRLFYSVLMALGLITVLSVGADSDSWVTTGATLAVMTVCATFDFRSESARKVAF